MLRINAQFFRPNYRKQISRDSIELGIECLNDAIQRLGDVKKELSDAYNYLPDNILNYQSYQHMIDNFESEILDVIQKASAAKEQFPPEDDTQP